MCFVKELDPLWPCVVTSLTYEEENNGTDKRKRQWPRALQTEDELKVLRDNVTVNGQCVLHLALQKNLSIEIIQLLVETDPKSLRYVDDDGNVPLAVAILHGCDIDTIEYLMRKDDATLTLRNYAYRTPWLVALEFACCCIQDDLGRWGGYSRSKRGLSNPPACCDFGLRSLCVVESILDFMLMSSTSSRERQNMASTIAEGIATIAECDGTGRKTVLDAVLLVLEKHDNGEDEGNQLRLAGQQRKRQFPRQCCRQLLRPVMRTPLHAACSAKIVDPALISSLVRLEPTCVLLKDCNGRTPLHLLCGAWQWLTVLHDRNQPAEIQRCMVEMTQLMPQALRVTDKEGFLPLHTYLNSTYWSHKERDPVLLRNMLRMYPGSAYRAIPDSGPVIFALTREALQSEGSSNVIVPQVCIHDGNESQVNGVVDSALLCLWVILSHQVFEAETPTKIPRCALYAVRTYLAVLPKPHTSRQLNQARCVLRLIVHALFTKLFAQHVLSMDVEESVLTGRPRSEEERQEIAFISTLLAEWQELSGRQHQQQQSCDTETLKADVVNIIFRDSQTLSKCLLLPDDVDPDLYKLIAPTYTPACLQPTHYQCWFFKPMSFYRYCKIKGMKNCELNLALFPVMMPWLPFAIVTRRLPLLLNFALRNRETFGDKLVEMFIQLRASIPDECFQLDDDDELADADVRREESAVSYTDARNTVLAG